MATESSVRSTSPSPQRRVAEEASSLANELALISDRVVRELFPAVLPSEQNVVETEFATQLVASAQKIDATKIQRYMDEQWNRFRQSNTLSGEKAEALLRAEWSRAHYYLHLRQFIAEQEEDAPVFASLQGLLSTVELTAAAQSQLRSLCASIDAAQTSDLGEYIDESWQEKWRSFPDFLRSELVGKQPEMKNAWFQNEFETILKSYVEAQHTASYIFAPELPVAALDEGSRGKAAALVLRVRAIDVPLIEAATAKALEAELVKVPSYLQAVVAQDLRKHFLLTHYFDILESVLERESQPESFRFEPELDVASLPDPLLREHATRVLEQVRETHVQLIAEAVQRAYEADTKNVPEYLRTGLEEKLRRHCLLAQYFQIVSSVVSGAAVASAFAWEPPFCIDNLSDEAARQSAPELCLQARPHHVPVVEAKVKERFRIDTARIDPSIMALHADTLRANWLRENYFGILREVIDGSERSSFPVSVADAAVVASVAPAYAPSNVFASPKKRLRLASPLPPSEAHAVANTVQELHTQNLTGSDAMKTTAVVLHYPEEPRWGTITDRKTKAQSQVPVVSVMLADASGPILLELWRDAADRVLRELAGWASGSNDALVWVEVRYAWCRAIPGRVIPALRKLVANDRTTMVRCEPPASAPRGAPSSDLYSVDFEQLTGATPFTICLRGIVTSVQDEVLSQSGNPMKNFKLHDQTGRFVHCVAFGRQVDNEFIVECNEIILYFAKAMPGLTGAHGQLWMYDENHIVLVGPRFGVPPARLCTELR